MRAHAYGLIRFFRRKKGYFITHILGIAVGLTAAGFSVLYIDHELSYDANHYRGESIYRVSYQNKSGWFASLAKPYSDALATGCIPEIESLVRVRRWRPEFVIVGDKKFHDQKVLFTEAGSRFFDFFRFPFEEGDQGSSLSKPNSVILSRSTATKYFGDKSAVGEVVQFDTLLLIVTGVFKDLPSNTHLEFDMLVTNQAIMDAASGYLTYARIREDAVREEIENKILNLPIPTNEFQKAEAMRLIQVRDLHYEGAMTYELKPPGNKSFLYILGTIGLTILLIAITNYLNLSVALYAFRSREIAVRKSVGASSQTLSAHFFAESAATVLIALAVCLILVQILLPYFNDLMQLRIEHPIFNGVFVSAIVLFTLLVLCLASLYPAYFLPRIRIVELFKGTGITSHHGLNLRQILLGIQFVVLFFVCTSLWVIHDQFTFMRDKDLGFDKRGVLKIKRAWNIDSTRYLLLKSELKKDPSILFVSEGYAPGDEDYGFQFRGENSVSNEENLLIHNTDYEYLDVLGIQPLAGPIVDKKAELPRLLCVVNEALAKQLGYSQPVGKPVILVSQKNKERTVTIEGVVRDYNFESLYKRVGPQMLFLSKKSKYVDENILIKIGGGNLESTLKFIEKKFAEIAPNVPVIISFLDEDLEKLYRQEQRLSKAVQILTVVSILLSLTGLIALCSYMVEFKFREIAIRKVLGASPSQIIALFSTVFVRLLVISFALGAVLSYWSASSWIEGFAYHTKIGASAFVLTFAAILVTTVLLAAGQAMRAVWLRPDRGIRAKLSRLFAKFPS